MGFMTVETLICLYFVVGLARADPCASRPCQNRGVCTTSNGITFVCKCPKGFFGDRCEKRNNACETNQCKNGVCLEDVYGDYHCRCSPGFQGKFCEVNHDDCFSSPCQNAASCVDKVDDYECVCKEGTFGKRCELRFDDIAVCMKGCPQGSVCWRNHMRTFDIPWGYGDNICNTQHSCFGGQNNTDKDHYDYFIDVQLHPLQIQLGDFLNFTSDDSVSAAIDGLMPRLLPVDLYGNSDSFVNCNTTNGTALLSSPQHNVVINSTEVLFVGLHYFIMNIDFTYRCDFGLRLNVSVKDHDCQNPQSHQGVLCSGHGQCHTNFSMDKYRCKCCDGFRGRFCEKRDYCFANPCKNRAICVNGDESNAEEEYICKCQPGYTGKHCSVVQDMCLSHPCRNNAICHTSVNSYHCQCSAGFTGKSCERNINECSTHPCQNNGTCVDEVADFSCICPSGFTGNHCEVDINECESTPCKHGLCIDEINGFHCLCHAGYTGYDCGKTFDECSSRPCLHGGVCIDKADSYTCDCGIGYEGKNCEKDINLCNKPEICNNFQSCMDHGSHADCICKSGFTGSNCAVNINDCASQPCHFGGKCQDHENGYSCVCSPGYVGKLCDQVNETFHDTSRLQLKIITENCFSLQDTSMLEEFRQTIAGSISHSCKCPFTESHVLNQSISLKCHDKISGYLYLHISPVAHYQSEQLICMHQQALTDKESIASLANNTFEVGVVYSKERCAEVNRPLGISNSENEGGGTIALTVGLVLSLVGLFTAAVIVFLKWRKKAVPAKKQKSDDKQLGGTMDLDLLSAIAPTPKSLYRTSRAAHRNYAFTGHNFDPVELKSKRI